MAVSADKLRLANAEDSGMVERHLRDVHWVCQQQNTFLFVRPSTAATMRLIGQGFATKSMDIHDKSSDWGLTSGFVPVDQGFNKKPSKPPNPDFHGHGHGEAQSVQLSFTATQLGNLLGLKHFESTKEVSPGGPGFPATDAQKYRAFESTRNADVLFLWERATGKVFWRWKTRTPAKIVPMMVWGYKGVPVTGDYDMWMVAPHITMLGGRNDVLSVKDAHGRSAAMQFAVDLIRHLNIGCDRVGKPVFNHGAEAQNVSFTQAMDRQFVVFCPGTQRPFMFGRAMISSLLHDLLRHGYVVVRNPKWKDGVTMGIEDMAMAPEKYAGDGAVKAGKAALLDLQKSTLAEMFRKHNPKFGSRFTEKDGEAWANRYVLIKQFRHAAKIPAEQLENIILPPSAFPKSGPGSTTDLYERAKAYGEKIEAMFGRTGFVEEDGHLMPVDASRGGQSGGRVRQMAQDYLKKTQG
jgi:hypothetical protein